MEMHKIAVFYECSDELRLDLRVSAAGGFFSVTAAGFEGWDFGGFVSTLLTDEAYRSMMPTIVEPDGASIVTRSVLCGS